MSARDIHPRGVAFALSAAILWGFVPVYIGFVNAVDAVEIVVHRALWSGLILYALVMFMPRLTGGIKAVRAVLSKPAARLGFILSCGLLTLNWGVFVYAVISRNVYETALGYFIYPLVAVMFGIALLGEKLDKWGWAAIGIVACGVLAKAQLIAGVPWIALSLAVSFALYGVVRKRLGVDPVLGMFVETVMLIPPAILYLLWMYMTGGPVFFGGGAVNTMLAVLAGVITVVPLPLYHAGNRDLPIMVAGLLFYANPTTQMLIGIYHFQVPFQPSEAVTFGLIWCGLALYFLSRRPNGQAA